MTAVRRLVPLVLAAAVAAAVVELVNRAPPTAIDHGASAFRSGLLVLFGAAVAYLVWLLPPSYTLTCGLVLSPMAGNWQLVGVPGSLSPQRLLLLGGAAAVLLNSPGSRGLPRPVWRPTHTVLVLVAAYAVVSALLAGTLFQRVGFFRLFDTFGVLPFLVFLVAPTAFRTERDRSVLLAGLVALGAYLGLTALFETAGMHGLVYPHFITSAAPQSGGRAPGVFLDAVSNGTALFSCGVASVIALLTWRRRVPRVLAAATTGVCAAGAFFTLERSVWLGAVAAIFSAGVVAGLRGRRLRLRAPVAFLLGAAAVVGVVLLAVPGLSHQVHSRATDQATVWDRQNLATAAENMIRARPLFGFGWSTFEHSSLAYFQQRPNIPLDPNLAFSTTTNGTFSIHNELLEYGATLGLVGTLLWLSTLLLALGGAYRARGAPDLERWRVAIVPVTVFYAVISNAVPPSVFPNLILWLWLGVVWSGYVFAAPGARSANSSRSS